MDCEGYRNKNLYHKQRNEQFHQVNIESVDHQHEMAVKLMKADKSELLTVHNPRYEKVIDQYRHLKGVTITEHDKKPHLAVHMVLGSGEYARIHPPPRIGKEF